MTSDSPNPQINRPRSRRRRRHGGNRNPQNPTHGPHPAGAQQGAGPDGMIPTLEHRCVRQFPRIALGRGREYFNAGRVSNPYWTGKECVLLIQGAGGNYRVLFDFSQVIEARRLLGTCDCPAYVRGVLCKHLWAAILQVDRASPAGMIPESGSLKLIHTLGRAPGTQPVPIPVRNGVPGTAVITPVSNDGTVPTPIILPTSKVDSTGWIDRLNQLQGLDGTKSARVISTSSLAFFVISVADTVATNKLVMDLWSRLKTTNGDLGPLRPTRVLSQDFSQYGDVKDRETLALLNKSCDPQTFAPYGRSSGNITSRFTVDPLFESHLVPFLASTGKLFLSRSPNGSPDSAERPIRMDRGKTWDLELKIETVGSEYYRLDGFLRRDAESRNLTEPLAILRSGFLIFDDRIGKFSEPRHALWANVLRTPPELLVQRAQGEALLTRILLDPSAPKVTWPADLGWKSEMIEPRPKGVFHPLGNDPTTGRMTLTVSFDYAGKEVALSETETTVIDLAQKSVYTRNQEFEEKTLVRALEILHDPQGTGSVPLGDLHRAASELCAAGWVIYIENQQLRIADNFSMRVSSSTDWFDLKLEANFGETAVTQAALLAGLSSMNGLIQLGDGTVGLLPQDWRDRLASVGHVGTEFGTTTDDGAFRFTRSQGLMLNAVLADTDRLKADTDFFSFRERVRQFEGVQTAKAPAGFKGKLRNYQKEGLTWLQFLEEFETGGILADDMGLGKTIQILAFLQGRKAKTKLPSLVVTPKSLAFNWVDEAARFVPGLKVVRYAGAGRAQQIKELQDADLVVTTYGTLRTDIDRVQEIEFDIAIVDEAQAIKNPKSLAAIACKRIRARHRIGLTGTPIENSLTDLLSILEYTNPGLLRLTHGEIGQNTQANQQALAKMLRPFMLRRTKEKVLTELPDKSEQVLFCEMSTEERAFYTAIRERYRASLAEKIEKSGLGRSKIHVLEALLRLRQASCHPGLVDPTRIAEPSAKLQLLLNHMQEVIQEGHKILVFSQFTSLLALVRTRLEAEKITYEYLDGKTEDRKTPVERFQTDPKCPVFLISLKAGGTGLNLTAADYVFILDPWWNPAVEAQAIGRAHRIGQSQKVIAYRMIAKGTVEEKILELQKTKKELAESIISEDKDFLKKLTREDLEALLT